MRVLILLQTYSNYSLHRISQFNILNLIIGNEQSDTQYGKYN